ncbi:MAG: 50S ribosomal protein L11 methyltransferase [Myxococcales bacterium]|nr:50S ribosomal protein L11 methyltransferase [Myxococcales bacterium]
MSGFWTLSAVVPTEMAEAAAWLLAEVLDSAVEVQDAGTLPGGAGEDAARVVMRFFEPPAETVPAQVAQVLAQLGLPETPLEARRTEDDGWKDAWKAWFHRQPLSARLWVRPPWEADGPAPAKTVVIDPGLAFGTGSHATTRAAATVLDELLAEGPPTTLLDVGAGSAILAIGAALLGHRAVGVEIDPTAVENARDNVALNGVTEQVTLHVGSVDVVDGPFPVVVANIIAPILIELAPEITARVTDHGTLVLSGLLTSQEAAVRAAYPAFDVLERRIQDGDWLALRLRRGAP